MQPNLKRASVSHQGRRIAPSGVTTTESPAEAGYHSAMEGDLAGGYPAIGEIPTARRRLPSTFAWRIVLVTGDTLLVVGLFILLYAFSLHVHIGWHTQVSDMGLRLWNTRMTWAVLGLFSWSMALNLTRAQEMTYAADRFPSVLRAVLALVVMGVAWTGLCWLFFGIVVARVLWLEGLYFTCMLPALCLWRVLLYELMRQPRFRARAVILGVNAAGEAMARALRQAKRPGIQVLGYIQEHGELPVMALDDLAPSVLGSSSALRTLVKHGLIDMIIIAFDYAANPVLYQDALTAAQLGMAVVPMAVAYEGLTGRIPVDHIGDQWYGVLPLEYAPSTHYLYWRTFIDIVFGIAGGAALLAILPILALLIVLDSPGPIFYSQERIGCRGKPFRILKFRSMRTDAEGAGSAQWANERDTRVTRLGRFLRATHLDELPQVLNILRGEMSLIGPRPERQMFIDELEQRIPFYRFRLSVKPGLTGWAQVKYPYASSTEDALYKLHYDLYYIKHQSLTLDIYILLKTVGEVLLSRGR